MAIDLNGLRTALNDRAVGPDDPGFDEARRVWNGVIDRTPAAVARCASVDDVVAAVDFARENGLSVTARGGGHNVAGLSVADGALVIDLSAMNQVTVDPEARTARAGGGCRLKDVDGATQAHGLATPLGLQSETGIAGITLGGGMGWLRRKHGLTCDNLVAAEVVTADGRVLTASGDENADLFWGLRGGGGGLGVVTAFEYRLHPVGPEVALAGVFYPHSMAQQVFRAVDDFAKDGPQDVSPIAFVGTVPAADPFPADAQGAPAVICAAVYPGDPAEGEKLLQPLRELGEAYMDISGVMPFAQIQTLFDEDYPDGRRYYWKSIHLTELPDAALDALAAHGLSSPSPLSTIDVWYQGGAMNQVGAIDTAFGDRSSPYLIGVEGNWTEPADDQANIAWVRGIVEDMGRFPGGGAYLNFPGFIEEGDQLLKDSYGQNYTRLQALKETHDPGSLFLGNRRVSATG